MKYPNNSAISATLIGPKPGTCPVYDEGSSQLDIRSCENDWECIDDKKCCAVGEGTLCADPVVEGDIG